MCHKVNGHRHTFIEINNLTVITLLTTGTPFTNQKGEVGFFGNNYLTNNTKPINGGTVKNLGKYKKAANIIKTNKEFIKDEVIYFVNTT